MNAPWLRSTRFGYYRQRLGVEEREDGRRQSRIDFHSWRRWFITHAREAGFDRAIVAAIVGQEVGNITWPPRTAFGRWGDLSTPSGADDRFGVGKQTVAMRSGLTV